MRNFCKTKLEESNLSLVPVISGSIFFFFFSSSSFSSLILFQKIEGTWTAYEQKNIASSRKQVYPIVDSILSSYVPKKEE